ncbi:MAG: S1C family serine protease [Rhizobiaceae bacterium]
MPSAHALENSLGNCDNQVDCAANSVVSLLPDWPANFSRNEEPEGSGIILDDGTLVATADHVLGPAKSARIRTRAGKVLSAKIVMRDKATDIAFLKVDEPLTAFSQSAEVSIADRTCAIGNSFGLDISIACGVVSAKNVTGVGFNPIEDFLQTDAAVNPGMSGGALVDTEGNLVGMLSAIFTRQSDASIGVNFAVSRNLLFKVLEDFIEDGAVRHRRPGIVVRPNNPELSGGLTGAEVVRVTSASPEDTAGFQPGDIVLKIGARRISRAGAYEAAIALAKDGKTLDVMILRGEDRMQLNLTPE